MSVYVQLHNNHEDYDLYPNTINTDMHKMHALRWWASQNFINGPKQEIHKIEVIDCHCMWLGKEAKMITVYTNTIIAL